MASKDSARLSARQRLIFVKVIGQVQLSIFFAFLILGKISMKRISKLASIFMMGTEMEISSLTPFASAAILALN
jgi:hypothetical protein